MVAQQQAQNFKLDLPSGKDRCGASARYTTCLLQGEFCDEADCFFKKGVLELHLNLLYAYDAISLCQEVKLEKHRGRSVCCMGERLLSMTTNSRFQGNRLLDERSCRSTSAYLDFVTRSEVQLRMSSWPLWQRADVASSVASGSGVQIYICIAFEHGLSMCSSCGWSVLQKQLGVHLAPPLTQSIGIGEISRNCSQLIRQGSIMSKFFWQTPGKQSKRLQQIP